jgi:L-lactate dehydrogenase complex protein LldF
MIPGSTTPFGERADRALANPALRAAVATATTRLVTARSAALEALPHADALRDHARRIRAHTIARLGDYLQQFAESVEARGGQVHWAATAEDARRAVVSIARAAGVRTIVKSKSMVTEEIALNHALESADLTVVETDLGEYVIQIAGEMPSHIIAPILHMTRADVADLFTRKLGADPREVADAAAITAFARRRLRGVFLRADMGISGANFGVAETGSIALVTNEGNGRLCTSAPRIHVAVMGIERVLPTVDDLGVMLNLLARNATGQKLSAYTSVITGPRRGEEIDGPEQVHVVLVDNGRSRLAEGELAEILYCIRCGACLNACPVYQQLGGHAYGSVYQGPVGSVLTPGLDGIGPWHDLPHASTLCGACKEVCPVRIDIPRMLLRLRAQTVREGHAPAWLRSILPMYRRLALRPRAFRFAQRIGARAMRAIARDGWIRTLPGPLAAWTVSRDVQAPAGQSFSARWRRSR